MMSQINDFVCPGDRVRMISFLVVLMLCLVPSCFAASDKLVIIDPPDASATAATAINNHGDIVGFFLGSLNNPGLHGFLRDSDGHFTTIDFPGASQTQALSINDRGEIIGIFGGGPTSGVFFRDRDGKFTQIDPVSSPSGAFNLIIKDGGQIAGLFTSSSGELGFAGDIGDGFATFAPPDSRTLLPVAQTLVALGLNERGRIVGTFLDNQSAIHAFLRNADGKIVIVDAPGAVFTEAAAINDANEIAGDFRTITDTPSGNHGFLRTAEGNFTTFDPPGSLQTLVSCINAHGEIAGQFSNSGSLSQSATEVFVRESDGEIEVFQLPSSRLVETQGINNRGQIVGFFLNSTFHGFILERSHSRSTGFSDK